MTERNVLQRGGEPQLTHQAGPVAQLFERGVPDAGEADAREQERQHDPRRSPHADHVSGSSATRPS